jgi:hypothetical protein
LRRRLMVGLRSAGGYVQSGARGRGPSTTRPNRAKRQKSCPALEGAAPAAPALGGFADRWRVCSKRRPRTGALHHAAQPGQAAEILPRSGGRRSRGAGFRWVCGSLTGLFKAAPEDGRPPLCRSIGPGGEELAPRWRAPLPRCWLYCELGSALSTERGANLIIRGGDRPRQLAHGT